VQRNRTLLKIYVGSNQTAWVGIVHQIHAWRHGIGSHVFVNAPAKRDAPLKIDRYVAFGGSSVPLVSRNERAVPAAQPEESTF
jgi:hypothetical protein